MTQSRTLFFSLMICCQLFSTALTAMELPQALSAEEPESRKLVDKNLLELHQDEISQILKQLPQILIPAERSQQLIGSIEKKNREVLKNLMTENPTQTPPQGNTAARTSVSMSEARAILKLMLNHPVTGEQTVRKYDTALQQIGFCFGRAAFVHWELLYRNVEPASLRKLFLVGDLFYEGVGWDFHMVTIVRNTDGGWLVIDALQDDVISPALWFEKMQKYIMNRKTKPARLYLTDPVKFVVLPGAYKEETLKASIYNGYFNDLRAWFQAQNRTSSKKSTTF